MPTRRQFLRIAASAAALGAISRISPARAEGPPYQVYVPLVGVPSTATPEPSPQPLPEPSPQPLPEPLPEPDVWPNDLGYILTNPSGTREQAIRWLSARSSQYTPYDVEQIVGAYARLGNEVGMDWFLALAQCAHETGSLTSWWCGRPRRNPAGIGVTGATVSGVPEVAPGQHWAWDGSVWREGVSFVAWDSDSIRAHLGRLLAYAIPSGGGTDAQRATIDFAMGFRRLGSANRGVALTYSDLDGRWAVPGVGYGQRILSLAARIRVG